MPYDTPVHDGPIKRRRAPKRLRIRCFIIILILALIALCVILELSGRFAV